VSQGGGRVHSSTTEEFAGNASDFPMIPLTSIHLFNSFPPSTNRSTKPLELIHSDVHGPIQTQTSSGFRYWITFIDDAARFEVVILQKKSNAFSAFKKFKAYAENLLDCKIKRFRDDKGGEYMSKEMCDFMDAAGIVRDHTVRNCPQQNGVAEKRNCTLNNDQSATCRSQLLRETGDMVVDSDEPTKKIYM
jgi:transposase InsO family protein